MLAAALATLVASASLGTAIITTDNAALRAAPRDGAQQQALLHQGEMVEVRGQRLDYLQVYDHQRERAGYVHASLVQRTALAPAEAPALLTLLRFVRDQPGREALGLGLAAAWLQAAPAAQVQSADGIEALDALGTAADRLARRATSGRYGGPGAFPGKAADTALAAQLDVAGRYGVRFVSYEHDGQMQVCYDGDVFLRLLGMPSSPGQRARAALGLTRPECVDPALQPLARAQLAEWRAELLDRVDTAALPGWFANQVQMRRASVWSELAWHRARQGHDGAAAMQRALDALAAVQPAELRDADRADYNTAAMQTNASRWAAAPAPVAPAAGKRPWLATQPGEPGQTCVLLLDARHDASRPLARRCTYSTVWLASATLNREGNALALAVQPLAGWRELWLFHRSGEGAQAAWALDVLPPAATAPGTCYAEFAGWVPGGRQLLVAREARGEGRYRRSFEVISLDSLATVRRAAEPGALGPFLRWQDPAWKRDTVSLR
ncbi:MAG: hypothetical protein AB7I35_14290 [Ramlibacter sp.]